MSTGVSVVACSGAAGACSRRAAQRAAAVATTRTVVPGDSLDFPRDHGAHPEFRTGVVVRHRLGRRGERGEPLGFQVTFFRTRPGRRRRESERVRAAPAPVRARGARRSAARPAAHDQRAARAGFGLAGAEEGRTRVWIDDWSLRRKATRTARASRRATSRSTLTFTRDAAAAAAGRAGLQRKGRGRRRRATTTAVPQLDVRGTRRARRRAGRGHRHGVARSRMVEHGTWRRRPSGWDWIGHQPRRRRRADGVSHARQGRRNAVGGGTLATRWPRAHVRAGRSPLRAAAVVALAAHRHRVSGRDGGRRRRRRASSWSR